MSFLLDKLVLVLKTHRHQRENKDVTVNEPIQQRGIHQRQLSSDVPHRYHASKVDARQPGADVQEVWRRVPVREEEFDIELLDGQNQK